MHDLKFGTAGLKMCLASPATQRVGSHLGNTAATSLSSAANRQKKESIFNCVRFFILSLYAFTQRFHQTAQHNNLPLFPALAPARMRLDKRFIFDCMIFLLDKCPSSVLPCLRHILFSMWN